MTADILRAIYRIMREDLEGVGKDLALMDITAYCKDHDLDPKDLIELFKKHGRRQFREGFCAAIDTAVEIFAGEQ